MERTKTESQYAKAYRRRILAELALILAEYRIIEVNFY